MLRRLLAPVLVAVAMPTLAAGPYPNTSAFGVPFSKDDGWYKQCFRVESLQSAPAPAAARASCKAMDLYDRKRSQAETSQAEWDQVRACALATNDNAVLMMLYANGYGVPRDRDRAIHYACIVDFAAYAEMTGRIAHLSTGLDRDQPFDLCDDVTSGALGGACAGRREAQDSRVRNARLDRVARALPAANRPAFEALRLAAERYAVQAGYAETDAQGTAAADFAFQHQARLREQAMQTMLDAIDGKLPPVSAEDFAARDSQLNQVYGALMAIPSTQSGHPDRIGGSTIEHAQVRKAERLWLTYRDAFTAFRARLPSGADADAIKAMLTAQRVAQLREVERYR